MSTGICVFNTESKLIDVVPGVASSPTVANAGQPVVLNSAGVIDPTLLASTLKPTLPVGTVSTNYNVLISDAVLLCTTGSSSFTVTMLDATSVRSQQFIIKKVDSGSGVVTIGTSFGQTIDGKSTYTLINQNQFVSVISDGTNWQVIGAN